MRRVIYCLVVVFTGNFLPGTNACASAALSCEHLVAVAQTTIAMRDQGHSLSQVLADVERAELREALNAQEINLLRQIVRISFSSEYSPREILEACKSGSLGIAKPKP
jgi:hypothetical protein